MTSQLTLGGGVGGGGILPASSWTDAVNKAKTYICVLITYTESGNTFIFNFQVPKNEIATSANNKYYLSGYYISSANNCTAQFNCTTSTNEIKIWRNGTQSSSGIIGKYYYDI